MSSSYSSYCHCESAIDSVAGEATCLKRLLRFARNDITRFFIFLTIVCSFYSICYAEDVVSSAELINNAKEYDGKEVVFKGEVIGDVMVRGDFAWINVNDGINAIGLWSKKDLARDIIYTGSYKSKGDIIEAKGIFHRACLEHGGDLDIHVDELYKIHSGMVIRENADTAKIKVMAILSAILCIVMLFSINKFGPSSAT